MAKLPSPSGSPASPWIARLQILVGVLLLWAAVSKLSNPTEFLGSIYAYELPLPKQLLKLAAVTLPWLELLCGLALLASVWTAEALATTLLLLSVFVLATGQAWARGLKISCGCFDFSLIGLDKDHSPVVKFLESPGFALLRNLALSAVTFVLLRRQLAGSLSGSSVTSPLTDLAEAPASATRLHSKPGKTGRSRRR